MPPEIQLTVSSVTIFSILRMRAIYLLYYPPADRGPDPTYDIGFVYSTVECNLAIITASIPPLHGLMRKWFPRFFQIASVKNSAYANGSRGLQTIGGSGIALRNLRSPSRSHHSRLDSLSNSEEEMLGKGRVSRMTSVQVASEPGNDNAKNQPLSYTAKY